MLPGSRVLIHSPASALPQTLVPFSGRSGILIDWEGETAIVKIGGKVFVIAAGHVSIGKPIEEITAASAV
jgi:hypothetical protein